MDAGYTGEKIAALRKSKNWTQKELAQQLHVTDKAVSKWERGLNYPDLSLLEPLAELLGISLLELLGIEQNPNTVEETVQVIAEISKEEKEALKNSFRKRAWLMIVLGCMILAAQIGASYIFAENGLYGVPQILTAGMGGFTGVMIGNSLYTIIHYKEL